MTKEQVVIQAVQAEQLAVQHPALTDGIMAVTLSPNVADAVNAGMLHGLEAVQNASPGMAAAAAVVGMAAAWLDNRRTGGVVNKMAWRSATAPIREVRGRPVRTAMAFAAITAGAAAPVGAAAFAFGLEHAVRTGQLGVVDKLTTDAGLDSDDLLVTQGGVNTPMDTSVVPTEVARDVKGSGFYVLLPNVREKNGERMDGLLFTDPTLERGTVTATGLTGIDKGQTVDINGVPQQVDALLDTNVAAMRREVMITSNDVAQEIMNTTDEEGNYWGVVLPTDLNDKDSVQSDLDQKYGEGAYSVMTVEEFKDGVEVFMANNGTAVLLLTAIIAAAGGTVNIASSVRKEVASKKKQIAVQKALGGSNYSAAAPEVQATAYKLVGALPLAALTAKVAETGANAANLGLGMNVSAKDMATALVIIGIPSVLMGSKAAGKIAKSTSPAQSMRETE